MKPKEWWVDALMLGGWGAVPIGVVVVLTPSLWSPWMLAVQVALPCLCWPGAIFVAGKVYG